MLDTLRKNSRSALIYVFFSIIIIVFVFSFGPGSGGCRSGSLATDTLNAAKVNGKEIRVAEFEQAYGQSLRQRQAQLGQPLSEELIAMLGLRQETLDRLVRTVLLDQLAAEKGFRITDQELSEEIAKSPAFQKDGVFDPEQYQLFVTQQLGSNPAAFEDSMRKDLLRTKFITGVAASAQVSDDEVKAEYLKQHEKIDLDFVRFVPSAFTAQVEAPTAAAIDAYLKDNAAKAEEYFNNHRLTFNKPRTAHLRQLVVKADEGASEEVKAQAKTKADAAHQRATQTGADFAALAREVSEDEATKAAGGDLGTVLDSAIPPFAKDAVHALKEGEVTPVLSGPTGFFVYKAETVTPEVRPEYKAVERDVAKAILTDEAAKKMAQAKAAEALAQIQSGGKKLSELFHPKAEDAARAVGPALENTGSFALGSDYIPSIGSAAELTQDAAALTEEKPTLGKVTEANDAFFVVQLKARERADLAAMAEKMDELRETLRGEKSMQLLETLLDTAKAKATIVQNEDLLAGKLGAGIQ